MLFMDAVPYHLFVFLRMRLKYGEMIFSTYVLPIFLLYILHKGRDLKVKFSRIIKCYFPIENQNIEDIQLPTCAAAGEKVYFRVLSSSYQTVDRVCLIDHKGEHVITDNHFTMPHSSVRIRCYHTWPFVIRIFFAISYAFLAFVFGCAIYFMLIASKRK